MNLVAKTLAAIAITSSLTGCIVIGGVSSDSDWRKEQSKNAEYISALELNVSASSVIADLGAPNMSEAFSSGDDQVKVLYYRTSHKRSDGETTEDETTALVFVNGVLIGWGDEAVDRVR